MTDGRLQTALVFIEKILSDCCFGIFSSQSRLLKVSDFLLIQCQLMIACFDEFATSGLAHQDPAYFVRMSFLRNIFREIGILTVLIGTNPDAVNMLDPVPANPVNAESRIWCKAVCSLPGATLNSLFLRKVSDYVRLAELYLKSDHQLAVEAFSMNISQFASEYDHQSFMNWIFMNEDGVIFSCRNPGILQIFLQHAYLNLQKSPGITALQLISISLEGTLWYIKRVKLAHYHDSEDLGQFVILFSLLNYADENGKSYYQRNLVNQHFASFKIEKL